MEKLAHRMARNIGTTLQYDEEKIAVMAYGLTALLQLIFIALGATVLGCLFGFFWEAMIVFFSVGFLRRLIGGAHSQGFNSCMMVSIFCIALFSAAAKFWLPALGNLFICLFSGAVYVLALLLIYRLAPVDSPNKPVRKPEKIRRLRRSAFCVMAFFVLVTAGLLYGQVVCGGFASYVLALDLSVLWQVLMLTPMGSRLIGAIDHMFHVAD